MQYMSCFVCCSGDQDLPSPDFSSTAQPMAEAGQAAVYQGGFYMDLHRMLGVQSGSEVHTSPSFRLQVWVCLVSGCEVRFSTFKL